MNERSRMVEEQLRRRHIRDERVLAAFERVPRDEFVPAQNRAYAYQDCPVPIGFEQTVSQPYVVALMVQALELRGGERVLDVGAGSGYAAAILACLAREVHAIERIPELARDASERLARLGFANVHVHEGDGALGWPDAAPFDAIAVAAAASRVPAALYAQLAIGGRLIAPIGDAHGQHLLLIVRESADRYDERDLGFVRFVPLVTPSQE
ncbi:MAG TPA: protein-L-isoaspartate(D-aspartate) O-methyltransferase [Kofleriaceae bacterium]|nr:protein-L-isoaspartate(D-aspartate) O-methyltransferase [Kofleriaceae bacterium]